MSAALQVAMAHTLDGDASRREFAHFELNTEPGGTNGWPASVPINKGAPASNSRGVNSSFFRCESSIREMRRSTPRQMAMPSCGSHTTSFV